MIKKLSVFGEILQWKCAVKVKADVRTAKKQQLSDCRTPVVLRWWYDIKGAEKKVSSCFPDWIDTYPSGGILHLASCDEYVTCGMQCDDSMQRSPNGQNGILCLTYNIRSCTVYARFASTPYRWEMSTFEKLVEVLLTTTSRGTQGCMLGPWRSE